MYVKIREHVDREGVRSKSGRDTIVPTHNIVYETDQVEYTKYAVRSFAEFEGIVKNFGEFSTVTALPTDEGGFEFIFITLSVGERFRFLVAPNASLFIMNKEGKTIDSISCF